jgi:hypothetical protein
MCSSKRTWACILSDMWGGWTYVLVYHEPVVASKYSVQSRHRFSFFLSRWRNQSHSTPLPVCLSAKQIDAEIESVCVAKLIVRNFVLSPSRNKNIGIGACTAGYAGVPSPHKFPPGLLLQVGFFRVCFRSRVFTPS